MARLEFKGESIDNPERIAAVLKSHDVIFEQWGTRALSGTSPEDVIKSYQNEINSLMKSRGYVSVDVVALSPLTPKLDELCAKFRIEHHHSDDEVRFVVDGEGIFELLAEDAPSKQFLKLTCHPGDLIVVPKGHRHLFYLTEKKSIKCIRLFRDPAGWEAIYN